MGAAAVRRVALEVVGWTLVLVGIAALVLPGPGLLLLFAGLVVLSQQYAWAERRVEPVKWRALQAASDGVQTWPRIAASVAGCAWLVGLGVYWGSAAPVPGWWPLRESWWLVGGWATGVTLIGSGLFALGLLVYSFRRYRHRPYRPEDQEPDDSPASRS
ncbi:PGPGW domain-containing protein [Nocardioides donggukensis]|nr:PGPGW domain-containing protein [Nocardioides donggukensis]